MKNGRERLSQSYGGYEIPLEDDGFDYVTSLPAKSESFLDSPRKLFQLDPIKIINQSILSTSERSGFVSDFIFDLSKHSIHNFKAKQRLLSFEKASQTIEQRIEEIEKRKKAYQSHINNMLQQIENLNQFQMFLATKTSNNELTQERKDTNKTRTERLTKTIDGIKENINTLSNSREELQKKQQVITKRINELKQNISNKRNECFNEISEITGKMQATGKERTETTRLIKCYKQEKSNYEQSITNIDHSLSELDDETTVISLRQKENIDKSKQNNLLLTTLTNIGNELKESQKKASYNYKKNVEKPSIKYNEMKKERKAITAALKECRNEEQEIKNENIKNNLIERALEKLISIEKNISNKNDDYQKMLERESYKPIIDLEIQAEEEGISCANNKKLSEIKSISRHNDQSNEQVETTKNKIEAMDNNIRAIRQQLKSMFAKTIREINPKMIDKIVSTNIDDLEKELKEIDIRRKEVYVDIKSDNHQLKKRRDILRERTEKAKARVIKKKNILEELENRLIFDTYFDLNEEERSSVYRIIWLKKSISDEMQLWNNPYNTNYEGLAKSWLFHLDKIANLKPKK